MQGARLKRAPQSLLQYKPHLDRQLKTNGPHWLLRQCDMFASTQPTVLHNPLAGAFCVNKATVRSSFAGYLGACAIYVALPRVVCFRILPELDFQNKQTTIFNGSTSPGGGVDKLVGLAARKASSVTGEIKFFHANVSKGQ
jgi:hypothetical protein